MDCVEFERWLDEGMPSDEGAATRAHALSCPRCAAEEARARAIESALATPAASVPAGFADRVLSRVEADARPSVPAVPLPRLLAVPRWVRPLGAPVVAIPLALALFLLVFTGRPDPVLTAIEPVAGTISLLLARVSDRLHPLPLSLLARMSIALGLLPAIVTASIALRRWCESVVGAGSWPSVLALRAPGPR